MYRCNNGVFYSLFPPFTRGNRCSPGKSMGFLRQNSKLDLNFRPVSDIIGNVKCRCDGMVDVTDSKSVGGDTVWVRVPPPAPAPPRATLPGAGFVFMMGKPARTLLGRGRALLAPAHCAAEGIFWCRSMIGTRGYPASRSCFYFFPLAVPRLRTAILPAHSRAGLSRRRPSAIRALRPALSPRTGPPGPAALPSGRWWPPGSPPADGGNAATR